MEKGEQLKDKFHIKEENLESEAMESEKGPFCISGILPLKESTEIKEERNDSEDCMYIKEETISFKEYEGPSNQEGCAKYGSLDFDRPAGALIYPQKIVLLRNNKKKRKIDAECRVFQEKWTEDYFFVNTNGRIVCLICWESVAVPKAYNLKRHYTTKHSAQYDNCQGQLRKDKIELLKKSLMGQQTLFRKSNTEADKAIRASLIVSEMIAKEMKPLSNGELVKECLDSIFEIMCPKKKSAVNNVDLSRYTVERRIDDLAKNIEKKLYQKMANFVAYSIALDENIDIEDIKQLAVFIRGVDDAFNITEEMAALVSMNDVTTGSNVFGELKKVMEKYNLGYDKLCGITTDGAPYMVEKKSGLTALVLEEIKRMNLSTNIVVCHCILHQENLCAKSVRMNRVMATVVSTINFIKVSGLNHDQFQELLRDFDTEYGDLAYYSEVRWLSRGAVLKKVWELREEIKEFMEVKEKEVPQFSDEGWLCDFAFVVDITQHLGNLSKKLQGKNQFVNSLFDCIKAFEVKLRLWELQLRNNNNMVHFPTLADRTRHRNVSEGSKYADEIAFLREEFRERFEDFKKHEQSFRTFSSPFEVDVESAPEDLQMELIDLQSDSSLKTAFRGRTLLDFYQSYLPRAAFPRLTQHALKTASLFGSTDLCEQLFSKLRKTEYEMRSEITEEQLQNYLRISCSQVSPDIDAIVKEIN